MPKTLIIDLDETVLHSWEAPQFIDKISKDVGKLEKLYPYDQISRAYAIQLVETETKSYIFGMFRPHLYEFLTFAYVYFDNILIWSAGVAEYVEKVTDLMFLNAGIQKPRMTWSRLNCRSCGQMGSVIYHKPIALISNDLKLKYYSAPFEIDPKQTLILDDKVHTFMENKNNGILIPPYSPAKNIHSIINIGPATNNKLFDEQFKELVDDSDEALLQFKQWLLKPEVLNSKDYTLLDKTDIFK